MYLSTNVHQWLEFEDSWPPSTIEFLLDILQIKGSETIYDPFVGCGTTPLVCKSRNLRTYSADISALAVLTTQTKLDPPSLLYLERLVRTVNTISIERLMEDFVYGKLEDHTFNFPLKLLKFVLAAILLRLGWHKGTAVDSKSLYSAFEILAGKMITDIINLPVTENRHAVECIDFYSSNPKYISHFSEGRLVLVSSPPFFNSNSNPAKRKIDKLLGGQIITTGIKSRPYYWMPTDITLPDSITRDPVSQNQVLDYLFFLNTFADHAVTLNSRAIAVEMGPKVIRETLVKFDIFLVDLLRRRGYTITFLDSTSSATETITLICAQRL